MDAVVGGYRVLDKIGHGGFGAVWRAQGPDGDLVALKVLHPQFTEDAEQVSRLVGEFMLTTRLDHPNIVRSRALVSHRGSPVLVMDLVPGSSLAVELRGRGSLPLAETAELARRIAGALDRAHAAGVVHRDVKPANILIAPAPDGAVPRLVDFGVALLAGSARHTASGHMVGTPGYLAPEVIRGDEPGPATDVYALGLLIHECATGSGVFGRGSVATLLDRHLNQVPDLPASWPAPMRDLVTACLAKVPADRPSAADVAAALTAFLGAPEEFPAGVTGLLPVGGVLGLPATPDLPPANPTLAGLPTPAGVVGPGSGAPEVDRQAGTPRVRRWAAAAAIAVVALTAAVLVGADLVGGRPAPAFVAVPSGTTGPTSGGNAVRPIPGAPTPVSGAPTTSGQAPGSSGVPVAASTGASTSARPGGTTSGRPGPGTSTTPGAPVPPRPPASTTAEVPPRTPVTATNNTDLPLPDGGGHVVASAVTLAAPGFSAGSPGVAVIVEVDVVHAHRGDLRVVVEAPNGFRHQLLAPNSRDHRTDFSARVDITAALPAGTPIGGRWLVLVSDNATGNTGYLSRWSVTA